MIKLTGISSPIFINPLHVAAIRTETRIDNDEQITVIYLVNGPEMFVKESADEVITMMNGQWR